MTVKWPESWGPASTLAVLAFLLVAIVGAVEVIRGHMEVEAFIAALTVLGGSGFIARGLWGRADAE